METIDLPPPYSTVVNVTMPSADVLISPQEIVKKEKMDEEPLVGHVFEDECTRTGFIQKVLLFILMQAVAVLIIMCSIMFARSNILLYLDSEGYLREKSVKIYALPMLCAYLITLGLLIFCDKARTKNPYKIIIYALYPVVYGLFVSFSTLSTTIVEMFIAWIFYCIAILAIYVVLMFSIMTPQTKLQSKLEFTTTTGVMTCAIVLLILFGMTALTPLPSKTFIIFYYTLAVFVECAYTVWDIQQMTSPKYRYAITPTDYVLGVLLIRIDYIYYITMFIKKSVVNCFNNLS